LFVLILAFLSACGKDISVAGFEAQKWREDAHGCKGYREKVAKLLVDQRKILIGANEKEIQKLLGKPDSRELQTRGQLYFVYEIKAGKGCESAGESNLLRIRFDALNRVTELAVY
jgi:hypothetical protein